MAVIGLDLGATKLAAALFRDDGQIIHRAYRGLEGSAGEAVGALIAEQLGALRAHARANELAVQAVAASVPGIYHRATATVWAPNIPGWEQYPLHRLLRENAAEGVAVAIDSDRACSILGEAARGAAQGCDHAVFLAVGTGIGAGVLADGRILRGADDIAGAVGWMALDRPFRPAYEQCGCFETHASGAGIERQARRLLAENPHHSGPLGRVDSAQLSARDVFHAFDQGDALASAIITTAVQCWGMAVANLVSIFNPQVVVFGGGLFGPAARLLNQIEAEARRWAQPVSMRNVAIRASALGPDACLYGTGQLALSVAGAGHNHGP